MADQYKDLLDSIDWLKWAIGLIVSMVSLSVASFGLLVKSLFRHVDDANKSNKATVTAAVDLFSRDMSEVADAVSDLDAVQRRQENTLIKQQGEIDGVIAVCRERHPKRRS